MNSRVFGGSFRLRAFNWADVVVLLSLVGLLAIVAWLGHSLWAPFTPDVPAARPRSVAPSRLRCALPFTHVRCARGVAPLHARHRIVGGSIDAGSSLALTAVNQAALPPLSRPVFRDLSTNPLSPFAATRSAFCESTYLRNVSRSGGWASRGSTSTST